MKRSELLFSFLLLPIDAAMIIASFVLSYYLRIKGDILPVNSDITFGQYLWYVVYILPFWLLVYALSGLYKISRERNYFNDLYKIFVSNSVVILIFIVVIFFGRAFFFSRLILILILAISVFVVFLGRIIVGEIQRYLYKYGYGVHKVIVVGNGQVAFRLIHEILNQKRLGLKFAGIVTGSARKNRSSEFQLLGSIDSLRDIVKKVRPDEVILTDISINRKKIIDIIQICFDANISFKFISDVFSMVTTSASSNTLAGLPIMELKTIALDGWGRIVKRLFDIIFSTILLVIFSPLFLLAALSVKLSSPGPVIFKQKRVGRDGKVFDFYKFRSMYNDKCDFSNKGEKWTTAKDEVTRITPIGRVLRKTNLDEIPQFYNVFRGDMSFVGPRPELPTFVDKFQKNIPEYYRRHRVKSGLTGWAVVNGLKGDTSIEERVRYDIFYIENWSFWFDLKIIIKTVFLVIREIFGGKYEYRHNS
jgi:exopolysaccharide biosynthesis polyprenyl glycosylphosphotransferase